MMFTKIENATVLVKSKLGYKELPLFVLEDTNNVYAKNGQYYIAILQSSVTSNASLSWHKLKGLESTFVKCHLVYEGNNGK